MQELMRNNKLQLAGKIVGDPSYSYEVYDEKFYELTLEISRLSKNEDMLPVVISEKLMKDIKAGSYVLIDGQIRTHNKLEDNKKKLLVFAFARDVKILTEEELRSIDNPNYVELHGFICKQPTYRKTPLEREITDLLIAVNRTYNKSDYIPAIAWGRNAKYTGGMSIGTNIETTGRFQSRNYIKKIDGKDVPMIAYEVSINKINLEKCEAIEA
jgi:single-stranded DNA-binding protein